MAWVKHRISDDAYDAIGRYCAERGISMTSLWEAFGRTLIESGFPPSEAEDNVITLAREITAERKSRRR